MDKFIGKWCFPLDDSLLEGSARRGTRYDIDAIADDIKNKMQFEKEDAVLDLCCGNGVLTEKIASCCKLVYGIDHSVSLIERAEKIKTEKQISNVHYFIGDALRLLNFFSENMFDKSYCYFSFQYFNRHKRKKLIKLLSLVTKRKGCIFIGDIPDKTRRWNFYHTKTKYYKEKISRTLQFKPGECNLGWWVEPEEINKWCVQLGLDAAIIRQPAHLVHSHYRFDVLIRNSK